MLERLKSAAIAVYQNPGVRKAFKALLLVAAGVFAESMGLVELLTGF